ncbi:MAG: NAD(P)(+) transhydrogenase (Re/Si-specific) subunit beta [Dehalococcoidia bacterium]|nr:NAD(P)(+) transhydrogenase (Re/Si-specific) subunit beta [Dehalococcoidia bacterium]
MTDTARQTLVQIAYLVASACFLLGLRGLTSPRTARRGMGLAAAGMVLAVIGTLLHHDIVSYQWIAIGIVVGAAVGAPMAIFMPMTAVPQRTAISHAFGALAVTLVGVAEYYLFTHRLGETGQMNEHVRMVAIGFEVFFGSLTITGSIMAFAKLQGLIPGKPMTYPFQNVANIALFLAGFAMFIYLIIDPTQSTVFYMMIGAAVLFGVLFVMPIGGADMPVVISLLNSYAGLAAAATGFAIDNTVLIVAGALDGASGFILSILMSKAMNRSFRNVLFGAFGSQPNAVSGAGAKEQRPVKSVTAEDAASVLAYSKSVIFVPGYGLAVAQAQHTVRELADLLKSRGISVKYAVHPVAGRMPGHMNVLLAEANVPYDELYDLDQINPEFEHTDVAVVVGANDVTNPAARTDNKSPIFGMPILNVDKAQAVIFMKRSMAAGFAGVDNELFYLDKTLMLFGDAKKSMQALVTEVKAI